VSNISGVVVTTLNTKGLLALKTDTGLPTVAFAFPANNARLTNGLTYTSQVAPSVALTGTATDLGLITNVTITRISPASAPLTNTPTLYGLPGAKKWTNVVTLVDGTNVFKAVAYDSKGNFNTLVVTRTMFYVNNTTFLTLATNETTSGTGTITSAGTATDFAKYGMPTNQAPLELARKYTVLATPGLNQIFTNWTLVDASGTSYASTNKLTFIMTSNLNLTATFLTNPVLTVTGKFNGLFYETNGLAVPDIKTNSAGLIGNLNVKTNGVFSGTLYIDGKSYTVASTFNLSGNANVKISRNAHGRTGLDVALHLDWTGSKQITGTVTDVTNVWVAQLTANLAVYNAGNVTTPARYTMSIAPGVGGVVSPGGEGYAGITNTALGVLTLSGKGADTTAITQTVPISQAGKMPFYVSLYGGRGLVEGWIDFSGGTPVGDVTWIKPATNKPSSYVNGFSETLAVTGSAYTKPASGTPALTQTNLVVEVTDADLAGGTLLWNVQLKPNNTFVVVPLGSATNQLIVSATAVPPSPAIAAADGAFSIKFRPTGLGAVTLTTIGAVNQTANTARGAYSAQSIGTPGTTNVGSMYLHPSP
jgi:hypothetical protein